MVEARPYLRDISPINTYRKTLWSAAPNDVPQYLFEYMEILETGRRWNALTALECGQLTYQVFELPVIQRLQDLNMLTKQAQTVETVDQWIAVMDIMKSLRRFREADTDNYIRSDQLFQAAEVYRAALLLAENQSGNEHLRLLLKAINIAKITFDHSAFASGFDVGEYFYAKIAGDEKQSADLLILAKDSIAELEKSLWPRLGEKDVVQIAEIVNPFATRMVEGPSDIRTETFLALCKELIRIESEQKITIFQIASRLKYFINYPEVMSVLNLHPLLHAVKDLESPGTIISGDAVLKWNSLKTIFQLLDFNSFA